MKRPERGGGGVVSGGDVLWSCWKGHGEIKRRLGLGKGGEHAIAKVWFSKKILRCKQWISLSIRETRQDGGRINEREKKKKEKGGTGTKVP